MKAVLLIGGRGSRLRPFTLSTPKPILPVANRPFLYYQLEVLRGRVDEVILCAADPAPFKRLLGERFRGVKLSYVGESIPLGTGGALRNAASWLPEGSDFLVLNGDVLNAFDIGELVQAHKRARALGTISLTRVFDPTVYGLVTTTSGGRILQFIEKPSANEAIGNTINAGAYVFAHEVLRMLPPGPSSLERDLFPILLGKRRLFSAMSTGYWIDIGTVDRYLQVHLDLLGGRTGLPIPRSRPTLGGGCVVLAKAAVLHPSVRLSGHITIGSRCRIEAGARLKDCVLLDGARIGANSRVERCIIGPNCSVGPFAALVTTAALAGGSVVGAYSQL